jgi:hypothetical protein
MFLVNRYGCSLFAEFIFFLILLLGCLFLFYFFCVDNAIQSHPPFLITVDWDALAFLWQIGHEHLPRFFYHLINMFLLDSLSFLKPKLDPG